MAGASSAAKNAKGAKAMKPSGVEWLGDIPEGWEVRRGKYLLPQVSEPSFSQNKVALENIESGTGKYIDSNAILQGNGIAFTQGDILYGKLRPYLAKVWLAEFEGNAVGDFFVYRAAKAYYNCYAKYVMLAPSFTAITNDSTYGAKMPRVSAEFIANLRFPIPPLAEQKAIAAYLDEKCGAIDAAIAEAKKGIEEYKAWKKSLIFEAVTGKKNLKLPLQAQNRVRKMKPSGIPWIGDVPEGWEVRRLKFVFDEITDGSHFSPETTDEGYPYITATDVRGIGIDFTKTRRISNKDYETLVASGCKIKKGDVLLVKDGATTGRTGLMVDNVNCVGLSSVAMLRTAQNNNRFLMYLLDSDVIQKQILLAMAGSAMPRITIAKINEFYGLLPPLPEQQAIADYLDEKCAAIDAMVAEKEALIADLEAYKKSLIYEVVTGKGPRAAAPGTKPTASGTGQGVA